MPRGYNGSRLGATIVELLIVIGMVGVLFSLSFPALMRAKAVGGRTKSLINARSCAVLIERWTEDHGGAFPVARDFTPYPTQIDADGGLSFTTGARWMTRHWWWSVMGAHTPPRKHWQAMVSPGSNVSAESFGGAHYSFSNSFVAAPELWTPSFNPNDEGMVERVRRDVRRHEVRSPSAKAMVWDAVMAYLHDAARPRGGAPMVRMPIAFADLHAEARRYADAAEAVPNPLNQRDWSATRLHNTPEGVEGRDY